MNSYANKTQKNKSQSVANSMNQKRSGSAAALQFVDNRPQAIAQRKLQEMVNNSPRMVQLRAIQAMVNNRQKAKPAAQFQAMADTGVITNQPVPNDSIPIQRYSYQRGKTQFVTLNSGSKNNVNKQFEICTSNKVTYDKGDQRRHGSGTGKSDWQGWLIDQGTKNNATQLHVVNMEWGGLGGTNDGNIGPGSQQLNGWHKGPEAKYKNLFKNGIAQYDMVYECTFDYSQGLLPYHNSTINKDVPIADPLITCDIQADDKNGSNFGESWVVVGGNSVGMIIRDGG